LSLVVRFGIWYIQQGDKVNENTTNTSTDNSGTNNEIVTADFENIQDNAQPAQNMKSIDRVAAKQRAKSTLSGKWIVYIIFMIIVSAVSAIVNLTIVGIILNLLVAGPFRYALESNFLKTVRRDYTPEVVNVFDGFRSNNLPKAFECFLRVDVLVFLWSLLLIVPGIIKSIAYGFTYFIASENPSMTPKEAQAESIRITRGYKWQLFVVYLSFIPWILFAIVTFGVGFFYVKPYMNATIAATYTQIGLR
jgi:uncharacterized membrane protein